MSIGVTDRCSSVCTFCSARANSSADEYRRLGSLLSAVRKIRLSDEGAPCLFSGGSGSFLMRLLIAKASLGPSASSNGVRPTNAVHNVAANE